MTTKVLSLYDGMACGYIAMILAGIDVKKYDAYEIDKFAIQTSKHNFPDIIHHGDVMTADFKMYADNVDYLVGGSPCTYWSIAQSSGKRETTASGIGWELFSHYVRALKESKAKYFIYENNKSMSNEIRESISSVFGFDPILINSALVSAQSRQRLYWVGKRNADGVYNKIDVQQPIDRKIFIEDTISKNAIAINTTDRKSRTLCARYFKNSASNCVRRRHNGYTYGGDTMIAVPTSDKSQAYMVKNKTITINNSRFPINLEDGFYHIRKLTVDECKRQQTVPEWYEFPVSDTQAYKMLGNGWTCEVIAHLIRACEEGKEAPVQLAFF